MIHFLKGGLENDDGHDFYLLKTSSESIILQENESPEWGTSFSRGSSVIRGMYFAVIVA
jgi:hypothetical protein